MRICLLVDGAFEPDCRAARIARALADVQHEVVIVPTAPCGDLPSDDVRVLAPGRSARVARLLPQPLSRIARRWAARRRARTSQSEVVHALGRSMLGSAVRLARPGRIPVVFDCAPDDGWEPSGNRALRRERNRLRACAAVITASESDAASMHERQRLLARPVVCREIEDPPPNSPTPANLRRRLRLGNQPLVLVHGGEPGVEQGIGVVHALATCPDVHLVVLGADRWRSADTMALEAERLRCASRFHLLRGVALKRLPAYAREADVGLCLSSGTRPRVLLEPLYRYAYAGLPVIVPPLSEGAHVVQRFSFGWIGEPTDHEQLRAVLERACGAERGSRRSAAARAGEALSWQAQAQVLVGLYQRLESPADRMLADKSHPVARARHNAAAAARDLRARRAQGLHTDPRAFIHHLRGRHLRARGEYSRSVNLFERSLSHAPGDSAAAGARAASLKDAGRAPEAIEAFQELLESQPDKANATAVNAAIELARMGVRREPRQVLHRLTDQAGSADQFCRAAELAAALGDVAAARKAIDRAVELAPDDPATRKVEVRVLEQTGEPERALAGATRASDRPATARLEGQLRVYDRSWLPASPPRRLPAPVPGRVLHLLETSLPHATSGYSYRTRTVLAAQLRAGLEPIAATRLGFPANRGVADFAYTEVVAGVVHHRFALPGVRRYTAVPLDQQLERNVELLAGLIESVRPATLQATNPHLNGLLGLSLRKASGVPLLYEVRGFPEMTWAVRAGGDQASAYRLRRNAETRCMLEADAVVTLSEVMKAHIIGRGVPAERVWVVPHMVDLAAIAPAEPSTELVRRYGLEGRIVVGYIGTLVDYEGIDLLVQALAKLRPRQTRLVGMVVGSGPAEPALRALAKESGLEGEMIFTGRIPHSEVNAHAALFDLFVLPRQNLEVCRWVTPLKPYEAMASGNCVLTSDVEALAETVKDGCGATFPAGDAEALAELIAELTNDPDRRAGLASRGREKMVREHDETALAAVAAAPVRAVTETHVSGQR